MFLENAVLKGFDVASHLKNNAAKIACMTSLIDKYSAQETPLAENLCLLEEGNRLLFDRARAYPAYDYATLKVAGARMLAQVFHKLGLHQVSSFCDVGCGSGYVTYGAAHMGVGRCVGIDNATQASWQGYSEDSGGKAEYLEMDILNESHQSAYQVVTSFNAFEHFADPAGMLDALSSFVETGGYLYIRFEPAWFSADGHHNYRKVHFPYYHLLFSGDVVAQHAAKHGTDYGTDPCGNSIDPGGFNRWTFADFLYLFSTFKKLLPIQINVTFNRRDYWFLHAFPGLLPFTAAELLPSGFEVIYHKLA